MTKTSKPKPLTYFSGVKICNTHFAKNSKVRIAKNASKACSSSASGMLFSTPSGEAVAGSRIAISPKMFSNAMEEIRAENEATERMQAVVKSSPVVYEETLELVVPVDGLINILTKDDVVKNIKAILSDPDIAKYAKDDLSFATYYPELFWNVAHHVGGVEAIKAADCSVVRACGEHLMEGQYKDDMMGSQKRSRRSRGKDTGRK